MQLQEIKGLPKIGDTANSAVPMATAPISESEAKATAIINNGFKLANPLTPVAIPVQSVNIPTVIVTQTIPNSGNNGTTVTSPAKPIDTATVQFASPSEQYFFKYSVAALGSNYAGKDAQLDNFIALLFATDLQQLQGISGKLGDWLNNAGDKLKDAYNNLSDAAKKVADELAAKASDIAKQVQAKLIQLQDWAKENGPVVSAALQNAWDKSKKYNPPLVAARNAYLAILKLNAFGYASLWNYGRMDDNQAALIGLNPEFRETCKQGYNGLVNKWNSWGGDVSVLNIAIGQGADNKPIFDFKGNSKISGIGEPEIAVTLTAAAAIIASLGGIISAMRGSKGSPADTTNPSGSSEYDPAETGLDNSNTLSQIQASLTAVSQLYNQGKSVMTEAEQAKYSKEIARLQQLIAAATAAANAAQNNTNTNPNPNSNPNTNNNDKPTDETPFYKTTAGVVLIVVGVTATGTLMYYALKPKKN